MRRFLRTIWVLGLWAWVRLAVVAGDPVPPPAPPLPTSPVARFRELLSMDAAHRAEALARRNESQRQSLNARLSEYDALPVDQREARLLATDLYWHLQQLLPRSAGERRELITAAPALLQPVLLERLALWDRLPQSDRTVLLQQERTLRYFAQVRMVTPPPLPPDRKNSAGTTPALPPVPTRVVSEGSGSVELSGADRKRLVEAWRRLFEAPPAVVQRQLAAQPMTEAERVEMETVLSRFRGLPAPQRRTCIESFARFTSLSASERASFLKHAERWAGLSASERQAWRDIVTKLPPLPPIREELVPPPMPGPESKPVRPMLTESRSGR